MDDTLIFLCKIGVVVGVVWMVVTAYCMLMGARAMRNAVRLLVVWYQDWFDSMYEEEPEDTGARPERRDAPAAVREPAPAPDTAEQEGRSDYTGAGMPPRASRGFTRRPHQ